MQITVAFFVVVQTTVFKLRTLWSVCFLAHDSILDIVSTEPHYGNDNVLPARNLVKIDLIKGS
jgi:hypothetical protein